MGEVERPLWAVNVYNKDKYIGKYLIDQPPYKFREKSGKYCSVYIDLEDEGMCFSNTSETTMEFKIIDLTWSRISDDSYILNVDQTEKNLQHLDKFIKMLK